MTPGQEFTRGMIVAIFVVVVVVAVKVFRTKRNMVEVASQVDALKSAAPSAIIVTDDDKQDILKAIREAHGAAMAELGRLERELMAKASRLDIERIEGHVEGVREHIAASSDARDGYLRQIRDGIAYLRGKFDRFISVPLPPENRK